MHLPVGALLQGGKYKIIRFISSGGFGCTYEAVHVMLEKKVAIKEFFVKDFCNRDESTSHVTVGTTSKKELVDKLRRKFVDEAKALSRLQHPNIVCVSDVFDENGTSYFVMNFIEGLSLAEVIKNEGSLSERRVLKYIHQVADALAYVHSNNRLHLDIKPANIMIDNKDNAILIDFGASKQYDEEAGENTSTLLGKTPGYAPLEQMGNDVVKFMEATDIYALGATMYKLLTGITPLGANLLASGEELAPLPSNVSANVVKAISAAMQINKSKRPQSISEFLNILDGEEDITVIDVRPRKATGTDDKYQKETQKLQKRESSSVLGKEKGMPLKVIGIILCLLIVVLIIVFLANRGQNSNKNQNESEPKDTIVIANGEQKTYKDMTYTYFGPLNDKGNAEGKGKGQYKQGTYEGEYVDGSRQGDGTFVTADGKNTFVGIFNDDMYCEGRLTLDDGWYFKGTFKDGKPYTGAWYDEDGTLYVRLGNGEQMQ